MKLLLPVAQAPEPGGIEEGAEARAAMSHRVQEVVAPSSDVDPRLDRADHVEQKVDILIRLLRPLHHGLPGQPGMPVIHEVDRAHEIAVEEPFGRRACYSGGAKSNRADEMHARFEECGRFHFSTGRDEFQQVWLLGHPIS